MKPADACVLTINGGSSSIKFALFEVRDSIRPIPKGRIERIGLADATFAVESREKTENFSRPVTAPDHSVAVGALMDWIGKPVDTSMGFTPAGGVPMSTRSGDLDPGLVWYLARTEHIDTRRFNEMANSQSGLDF